MYATIHLMLTCILIDKVKYNKNVSATLSIFDLEIHKGRSTLMTFFLLLERHDRDTDTSDSMAIQQLTDAEVEESEEDDEEEGQGGGVEKMT